MAPARNRKIPLRARLPSFPAILLVLAGGLEVGEVEATPVDG
jgi:hypothetical protein